MAGNSLDICIKNIQDSETEGNLKNYEGPLKMMP